MKKKRPRISKPTTSAEPMRLNRYIANAGICSRRDADRLIENGEIKINGEVVTVLGTKVMPGDKVYHKDRLLQTERLMYVLLNKPKGYITTTEDPFERKTVMSLMKGACRERIYPIGRLDRGTTGLLLFTNDGAVAEKLNHPKNNIKKIYHVVLDRPLTKTDMAKIAEGVELEDGFIQVDAIRYAYPGDDKKHIGVELHSGKNRIVRRIFGVLEYEVFKLDRVFYAGLTKKDLPRGRWRHLEQHEINMLKMLKE